MYNLNTIMSKIIRKIGVKLGVFSRMNEIFHKNKIEVSRKRNECKHQNEEKKM